MNVWQGSFPRENTRADGFFGTCPVDAFEPNSYGLYNTTGNVWEWCADWYDADYYSDSPEQDPSGPLSGVARVIRGGGWLRGPRLCRSAYRGKLAPDDRQYFTGFRVCVTIASAP